MAVIFTDELNIEQIRLESALKNYFVQLRAKLGALGGGKFSHGLPILATQRNPPTQLFDVVLRNSTLVPSTTITRAVKLRVRADNLYLLGYQTQDSAGNFNQWFEFLGSNLITGSKPLKFDGGYTDLIRVANTSLENIALGQQPVVNAINYLSISTSTDAIIAASLVNMILLICESTRFTIISDHLGSTFTGTQTTVRLSIRMVAIVHGWGVLSAALLKQDADPDGPFNVPPNNSMEIQSAVQAVAVLGILLGDKALSAFGPVSRIAVIDDEERAQGRPLVEVYNVLINLIEGESDQQGDELYGTVKVIDGLGSQDIYNQTRRNGNKQEQIIKPYCPTSLLINGPGRAISALGSFTIDVAIMDKDNDVSNGQISWNVYNTTNVYDKTLTEEIKGKHGSAIMNYIVLSEAVEATMEVMFIKGADEENPAATNMNGSIAVCYGDKESDEVMSVLFQSKDFVVVTPGQLIPLLKSVVAVPLNSSIVVKVDLRGQDDQAIVQGQTELHTQLSGASELQISGKYGGILMKVIWN